MPQVEKTLEFSAKMVDAKVAYDAAKSAVHVGDLENAAGLLRQAASLIDQAQAIRPPVVITQSL